MVVCSFQIVLQVIFSESGIQIFRKYTKQGVLIIWEYALKLSPEPVSESERDGFVFCSVKLGKQAVVISFSAAPHIADAAFMYRRQYDALIQIF